MTRLGFLHALPLRWRLTLLAALSSVVVLVFFDIVLYAQLESAMLRSSSDSLRISAQPFINFRLAARRTQATPEPAPAAAGQSDALQVTPAATPVGGGTLTRSMSDNARTLNDLAKSLTTRNISARTFDVNGALVGDGPVLSSLDTGTVPRLDPGIYQDVVDRGEDHHLRATASGGPVLVALIPLVRETSTPPEVIGVLELSTSYSSIDQVLYRLRTLLLIGTLVSIAAIVLLSVPLIRHALRPLRQMAATSRAIAAGEIRRRVDVPRGNDELTEMASAFNEMVGQLEAILKTQRHFLADASHELRSPLTALGGGIEMLLMGADQGDPAARRRLLQLMEGELARMGRLVDDLLTLSRFDARPEAALQIAPVDLTALLTRIAEETRLLAPDRNVDLVLPTASALIVPGDGDRLQQALLNLSANARAYTPPGGTITLALRRAGTAAVLTVADTGSGIAEDDLPNVWSRFYRADRARSRPPGGGGLGLGLSIVRSIVEAHHGTVQIESKLGAGTTVTLTLPGVSVARRATPITATAPARG